jgi:hypothetical protein
MQIEYIEKSSAQEAKNRAKQIVDKPHLSLEDRQYIKGFADGYTIGKNEKH